MIDLKDYDVQPDDGLFEKIQHRLAVRRAVRIGGRVLAGIAVAAVAFTVVAVLSLQDGRSVGQPQKAVAGEVGTASTAADNMAVTAPGAPQQPISTTLVMPLDTTPEMAETIMPKETAPVPEKPIGVEEQTHQTLPEPAHVAPEALGMPVIVVQHDEPDIDSVSTVRAAASAPKSNPNRPVEDTLLWAPNIILPNADVEENRVFFVKLFDAVSDFRLQIYNRRGLQVYKTDNPTFSWTAEGMPQGGYVWVATFRDSQGRPHRENGTVIVVR